MTKNISPSGIAEIWGLGQNAVERDIQTILSNVSATIHGQDFMRADIWVHALTHWTRLHNAFPHAVLHDTPARLIDPTFMVDAHHQFRFVFGDLLCFPLQDHERLWKFDAKKTSASTSEMKTA